MEEKRKELKTLRNIALSIQFLKPELAIFEHIWIKSRWSISVIIMSKQTHSIIQFLRTISLFISLDEAQVYG
jgi:hypothetical protein